MMWMKNKVLKSSIPIKSITTNYDKRLEFTVSVVGLKMNWFVKMLSRFVYVKITASEHHNGTQKEILDTRMHIGDVAFISHKFELEFK